MTTPTPRRQPPDVRREQILDAAARVLVERGLAATTMADVAEAASVAKGTVYLYFTSKAELLAGLRARYFEGFAAMVDGPPAAGRPAPGVAAGIERLVAASYDFALANHQLHHVLFHQAGYGEEDTFARARTGPPTSCCTACTASWWGRRTGRRRSGNGWSPASPS